MRGFVEATLRAYPEKFGALLARSEDVRMQVLIGVEVSLTGDPAQGTTLGQDALSAAPPYFYPASAIKLPAAVAALAAMEVVTARDPKVNRNTPLVWLRPGGRRVADDKTSPTGKITLAWEVEKALVVSDNEAFNHLYEFVGHREIHEHLWRAGLGSVRIWHRLSGSNNVEVNKRTPAIEVLAPDRAAILRPALQSTLALPALVTVGLDVGQAYLSGRARIAAPMSFREKNAVELDDLQNLLAAIVRPDLSTAVDGSMLGLTDGNRQFLVRTLGRDPATLNPAAWSGPGMAETHFHPSLGGVLRVRPRAELDVRGKAGRAFGFHVENAYYRDLRTGRALFLAAVLYVNEDGTMNDNRYEYGTVSMPFMADLGEVFARAVFDSP